MIEIAIIPTMVVFVLYSLVREHKKPFSDPFRGIDNSPMSQKLIPAEPYKPFPGSVR
jgi:hypothetical protein